MRDNTNPIYLTEDSDGGLGFLGGLGAAYATGAVVAPAIKYARSRINRNKILKRYPTAESMKEALSKINSPNAQKLIAHLDLMSSQEDYINFISKYLCGNTTGRYIASILLPGSTIFQASSALSDINEPTYDIFLNGVN